MANKYFDTPPQQDEHPHLRERGLEGPKHVLLGGKVTAAGGDFAIEKLAELCDHRSDRPKCGSPSLVDGTGQGVSVQRAALGECGVGHALTGGNDDQGKAIHFAVRRHT